MDVPSHLSVIDIKSNRKERFHFGKTPVTRAQAGGSAVQPSTTDAVDPSLLISTINIADYSTPVPPSIHSETDSGVNPFTAAVPMHSVDDSINNSVHQPQMHLSSSRAPDQPLYQPAVGGHEIELEPSTVVPPSLAQQATTEVDYAQIGSMGLPIYRSSMIIAQPGRAAVVPDAGHIGGAAQRPPTKTTGHWWTQSGGAAYSSDSHLEASDDIDRRIHKYVTSDITKHKHHGGAVAPAPLSQTTTSSSQPEMPDSDNSVGDAKTASRKKKSRDGDKKEKRTREVKQKFTSDGKPILSWMDLLNKIRKLTSGHPVTTKGSDKFLLVAVPRFASEYKNRVREENEELIKRGKAPYEDVAGRAYELIEKDWKGPDSVGWKKLLKFGEK